MSDQPDLFPRTLGQVAGEACEAKAQKVAEFDSHGASAFILVMLDQYGKTTGEMLVDAAIRNGFKPHDARAFGPVFARLARNKLIRCVGIGQRAKGHGTAGARIWEATR
jgi:hypothetical protein